MRRKAGDVGLGAINRRRTDDSMPTRISATSSAGPFILLIDRPITLPPPSSSASNNLGVAIKLTYISPNPSAPLRPLLAATAAAVEPHRPHYADCTLLANISLSLAQRRQLPPLVTRVAASASQSTKTPRLSGESSSSPYPRSHRHPLTVVALIFVYLARCQSPSLQTL